MTTPCARSKPSASRYAIAPGWIELELTESSFFDDHGIAYVKKQIDAMHQMGFLCSLDDFGSGYSSLGLLMEFDVDVIKFDRRFFAMCRGRKPGMSSVPWWSWRPAGRPDRGRGHRE